MKLSNRLRAGMLGTVLASLVPLVASAQVGANVGQLLDPNRATAAELSALPGLNAEIAEAIVGGRPWLVMTRLDEMLSQRGLAEAQRETLYGRLWDPLNLNATTAEEILLIPGAGDRVVREFQEYAPYANLAVFNREMSKYWDAEEVARLAQYVFVPIDLNTTTAADILTIPGSGQRVVREFMEYRPYVSMEQFRREMLKYWQGAEVARLEQYVKIGS
ncbi:MAG: helix-hairpin-helix domain-containing protein [Gemmatimonadota bacterium]